jgi:hypothetical protein
MRTSLGVLLAALAAGGCSIALDMDRFGKGGEVVADSEVKETQTRRVPEKDDASSPLDAGTANPPAGDTTPATPPPDGGTPAPPVCTRQESEPNGNETNGDMIGPGTTTCGTIASPSDADWFEYTVNAPTTVMIDSHPNVTATFYRNGLAIGTHDGGQRAYIIAPGRIQIWVVGAGPGMLAYRIALK